MIDKISEWFHKQFYRIWYRIPDSIQVVFVAIFSIGIMVGGFIYLCALMATATM